MKKMKFKCYIKNVAFSINNVYNFNGNLDIDKKLISYKEDNIDVNLSYKDRVSITRDSKEYRIDMVFIPKEMVKGVYLLKETNTELNLNVFTNKVEKKKNSILINYDLTIENESSGNFEYYLEWSVII